MKNEKLNFKLLNLLIVVVIAYFIFITSSYWGGIIKRTFSILLPFFISFVMAYVLYPFVRKLEKKGVRKSLALTTVILTVLLIIAGIIFATIPVIYDQLVSFTKTVSEVITDATTKFDIKLGGFEDSIMDGLNNIVKDFGKYISTGTIDILGKSVNFLTNAIIILVVGIYFLIDMETIREKIKKLLKKTSKKSYYYVKQLDLEIGNYFHGLAVFMLIQLIEYSILFRLVGHPNWLLLGVLACVTTIIPYFGGLMTNIIAVITASAISMPLMISTLIITLIFPNIDGYLISPHIYGKTNNVNPVIVIMIGAVFSSFFGIIGMAIALPVYIIVRCTWKFYNNEIKEKFHDVKESME